MNRFNIHILFLGLLTSTAAVMVQLSPEISGSRSSRGIDGASPKFQWTRLAPPGSGTHQHEWKAGTYPSAIVPVQGFDNTLWMVGQKMAWTSSDGIRWQAFDKHDWGERISVMPVFFRNTLWMTGGMDYSSTRFLNEIWSSKDGKAWTLTVKNAEWSPRKNHALVVFKNRLWLFGGETSVDEHKAPNAFVNDVWSSDDGIGWTRVLDKAPWELRAHPRAIVFKDKLWIIGGQGHSDVWNSMDGVTWKKIADESPWTDRYDYGAMVFDDFLWVYGGRESNPRNAYHDVWFSPDGVNWILQTGEAPWTKRSGNCSVAFGNRLFLYGGKHTGHEDGFSGDIWALERVDKR